MHTLIQDLFLERKIHQKRAVPGSLRLTASLWLSTRYLVSCAAQKLYCDSMCLLYTRKDINNRWRSWRGIGCLVASSVSHFPPPPSKPYPRAIRLRTGHEWHFRLVVCSGLHMPVAISGFKPSYYLYEFCDGFSVRFEQSFIYSWDSWEVL